MTRVPLIAGNWKMYKTGQEAVAFITELAPLISSTKKRVWIAPSFTALEAASSAAQGTKITIGAQNMHDLKEGAMTGEISAGQLKAAGVSFVLLGHSERRIHFGETNAFINRKIKRAFAEGLLPVLCIGETLEERTHGKTVAVLSLQLEECLQGIAVELFSSLIVAYEPVWAIGTGQAATPDLAQQAHHQCRHFVKEKWGKLPAEHLHLLYGGSVKPDNIATLMAEDDIDGVLVGGAALEVKSFAQLVNY